MFSNEILDNNILVDSLDALYRFLMRIFLFNLKEKVARFTKEVKNISKK